MTVPVDLIPTLSRLLDEAFDLSPAQREHWLSALPEEHQSLAAILRSLLSRRDAAETRDILRTLPKFAAPDEPAREDAPARFVSGDSVGPYRLLSELGRGGMGEVWLAERVDHAPSRRVALKLPHTHLPRAFHLRFARERDILAELSHPHIAQLYDAGISDSGDSFLAMEWVDGTPITQFCRDGRLPLEARIALFEQVLDAVHYAHAHFIAHRDLKPANILVTREGQVKLLDFGIAKLLHAERAATELTELGGRAATPDYAAPEQMLGEPITTAVDLYSAGVILFELMTGTRPFTRAERIRGDAPLASQRVVEEEALLIGGVKAPALRRALHGDLDAIIARALDSDPALRYRSAEAMSDDLRRSARYEPISARRIGRLMLLTRFARRHRLAVGLASALLFALIAGGAGIGIEAVKASAAAQRAQAEALRAQSEARREAATKDFLVSVFSASDPRVPADKPRGTVTTTELLQASAGRIGKEFASDPDTQIELLGIITEIFDSQHDYEHYRPLHTQYVDAMKKRYGETDKRVITGLMDEADHALLVGDQDTAAHLLDETDALLHKTGLDRSRERALWWHGRADLLRARAVTGPERVQALENSIKLYSELAPTDEVYAAALSSLGGVRYRAGNEGAATDLYQRAIQVLQSRFGAEYSELSPLYINLGQAQAAAGEFDTALDSLRRAAALALKSFGPTHSHYIDAVSIYARLLLRRGQRQEALAQLEPLLANTPRQEGGKYTDVYAAQAAALVREDYGDCLLTEGRPKEAIAYLEDAVRIYAALPMYSDQKQSFPVHLEIGEAEAELGRVSDAHRELATVVAGLASTRKADDPLLLRARESFGRVLQQQQKLGDAEAQFREVVAEQENRNIAPVARAYADLALLAAGRGDAGNADLLSRQAVDTGAQARTESDVRLNPWLWDARARVLLQSGHAQQAYDLARRALDAERRYDDPMSIALSSYEATLRAATAARTPR